MDAMLRRILSGARDPELLAYLAEELAPTDLQTLMLEVSRRRVKRVSPRDLSRQYETDRFVQPANVDPRFAMAFDQLAFSLLPVGYEPLELSPLAPFGVCPALAPVDQINVVSTVRRSEVCSDPTNVMALESVRRLRDKRQDDPRARIHLATSHRVARAQFFDAPGAFAHFRLLAMTSAGRSGPDFAFEIQATLEHSSYYLSLLESSRDRLGLRMAETKLILFAFDPHIENRLQEKVLPILRDRHHDAILEVQTEDRSEKPYYRTVGFRIWAKSLEGEDFLLGDGGLTDWTAQLMSDRKERFLISALGSERLCHCFGPNEDPSHGEST